VLVPDVPVLVPEDLPLVERLLPPDDAPALGLMAPPVPAALAPG